MLSGTSNAFRHFAGSYAVQWEMINYALNHGIDRYNFYGVSGKFTEDAEDAGVVKFKKVTMLKLLNMLVTLLNQLINLFTQHIPHLKS